MVTVVLPLASLSDTLPAEISPVVEMSPEVEMSPKVEILSAESEVNAPEPGVLVPISTLSIVPGSVGASVSAPTELL